MRLGNLLYTKRTSSNDFGNATLKNMKERNGEGKNSVLYVRKDPDMTWIHKKELDERFTTDIRKYREKKPVVETSSAECENSRTSGCRKKIGQILSTTTIMNMRQLGKYQSGLCGANMRLPQPN